LGMVEKRDVVIGISKSGNTQEIKNLIPFLKNNGNLLIGMTANAESFLAKQSDHLLYTPVAQEACPHNLAPTTSTTVQMVLGDALAMSLMELNGFQSQDFAQIHPSGSLGKMLHLKVLDLIANSKIPRVSIDSTLKDVIYEISEKRLGATIVEENGIIRGLITDGDIRRVLEKHENIGGLKAAEVMTQKPISVNENLLAFEALKLMQIKKINHLIVLKKNNSYRGIVHVLDFIKEGLNG
jgi:arabinose-5-phosphate isomerase